MKKIIAHNQKPWFELTRLGIKRIEGRLCRGKFAKIKSGDFLCIISQDEKSTHKTKVLAVRRYKNFRDMLRHETLEKVLPGVDNLGQGVEIYRKYYSAEDEEKYGVVAIEIEPIKLA